MKTDVFKVKIIRRLGNFPLVSMKMLCLRVTFVFLLSNSIVCQAFRSDFQGHNGGRC